MATKQVKGNAKKYASYVYAFKQIDKALNDKYYLEALTLCESIISDRLLSYLRGVGVKGLNVKTPLYNLIVECKSKDSVVEKVNDEELIIQIDRWRDERNKCIHSAAKSEPSSPTHSVKDFREKSKQCAEKGRILARAICDWHKTKKSKGKL